jgi:hypothetical protein
MVEPFGNAKNALWELREGEMARSSWSLPGGRGWVSGGGKGSSEAIGAKEAARAKARHSLPVTAQIHDSALVWLVGREDGGLQFDFPCF